MILTRQAARLRQGLGTRARAGRRARRRPTTSPTRCSPSPARSSTSTAPPAGRLVLATTTPDDMIRPLAAAPGLRRRRRHPLRPRPRRPLRRHHRRRVRLGQGQARARCAGGRPTTTSTLADSWAYSDSFYDLPLLRRGRAPGGGQPRSRGCWPSPRCAAGRCCTSTCPTGVPKVPLLNIEPQRLVQAVVRPELLPWVRFDIDGRRPHPRGRAGHHRRQPPQLLRPARPSAPRFARRGRPVRFLGKQEVFDAPVVGQVARALGGIRVDRGTRLRRAADGGSRRPGQRRARGRSCPQGTIPRGGRSSTPC